MYSADGQTRNYDKLPLRDKAGTCYEQIRDTVTAHEPVDQVPDPQSDTRAPISDEGTNRVGGEPSHVRVLEVSTQTLHLAPLLSDVFDQIEDESERDQVIVAVRKHDKMMDEALSTIERGKAMMMEANLKLASDIRKIIGPSSPAAVDASLHDHLQNSINRIVQLHINDPPSGDTEFAGFDKEAEIHVAETNVGNGQTFEKQGGQDNIRTTAKGPIHLDKEGYKTTPEDPPSADREVAGLDKQAETDDALKNDGTGQTSEANKCPTVTYKRKKRGKRLKDMSLMFQIPIELGLPAVLFQLAPRVTTRANKFTSPFKAPMVRREPPDVDKSMKLREIIFVGATGVFDSVTIFKTKLEYRIMDIDCCSSFAPRVADSFVDNKVVDAIFIHFFSLCLLNDEKEVRPTSVGYRVILPDILLDKLLYEKYNTGSQYSVTAALALLEDRYKEDDLMDAKLVLINILDPYPWDSNKDQMAYHGCITGRIRWRLHEIFTSLSGGQFADISTWSLPFIEVPKQMNDNNSGCFAMLFMEHYDGENRKMDISLDPELISQYKSQVLYYMAFNKINEARPLSD